MTENFQRYSQYYDLLYAEKNYQKEVNYVENHIRQYSPGVSSILELGSGTGNHAKHFAAAGYSVTGIERSREMADFSKAKKIQGFTPVLGD
ncbi:MAG: class I SAM-dependent methyltransferase, partial [Chitinophagaceae bacterium]